MNEEPRIQILNDYLEEKIEFYNAYTNTLDPYIQPDTKRLNELFRHTLQEVWDHRR